MISDTLERLTQYYGMHPHLDTAIRFLMDTAAAKLPDGRHEIDGDRAFVNVMRTTLGDGGTWEAHHNYIDLQLALEGTETIAWAPVEQINDFSGYDAQKDIMVSSDPQKGSPLVLKPGMFGLFFPSDAHQPGIGTGQGRKAVVKIKADARIEQEEDKQHIGTQPITTPRLVLRRFEQGDAQAMFDNWCSDPEVAKTVTWDVHPNVAFTQALLDEWVKSYTFNTTYHWGITLDGELIGDIATVSHSPRNNSCAIGYCLSRKHWNQGIATEALIGVMRYLFKQAGYQRIVLHHELINPASGRVMQKAGLQFEGIMRRTYPCKGHMVDLAQYAALDDEWISHH